MLSIRTWCGLLICCVAMIDLRAVDAPPYTPSLRASADEPEALLPGVDWVGPEGIVYPDFSRVGVDNGKGIPDTDDWGLISVSDGYAGADVDGDLTAELRRAIDDAGELWQDQGLPGCVVELPAGTWRLSGPLAIESDGILIRGQGREQTRIDLDAPISRSDADRPINEVDAPIVDVDPYLGNVHRFSSLVTLVDPRYDYKDGSWDEPGASPWRRNFPRHTVKEVRLYLYDPDTCERVQDDGEDVYLSGGGILKSNLGAMAEARRLEKFYDWREYLQSTLMVQPEVAYDDGTVLTGAVTSFPCDWDGSPDFKRSANGAVGWFVFAGDEWSHRGDEVPLTRPAARGDTRLHLAEDVRTRTNPDFGAPGDLLQVQIYGDKDLPYKNHSGATRRQVVSIAGHGGSDGEGGFIVELAEPLRFAFPLSEDGMATTVHARITLPWRRGGVEGIAFHAVDETYMRLFTTNTILQDFWLRDLLATNTTADALWFNGTDCEIRDCHFRWARWPDQGTVSYIGGTLYDSIIDGISAVGYRHAPNLHGGANVVVRNSWFDLSDAQLHAGNGTDLLYENIRTRADGRGSYGNAMTIREWDESQGGGAGDRLVLFGCDLSGPEFGVDFGGRNEAMVLAYNRLHAGSRALFQLQDGSFDHVIIGNHLLGDNRFEPVFQMGEDDSSNSGTGNTGVHFVDNRIYGSSGDLTGPGAGVTAISDLARSDGNVFLPVDGGIGLPSVPPDFVAGSLYQTQVAHPDGLAPVADPAYDPSAPGAADRPRNEGALVAQVNFGRDGEDYPSGWLLDAGGVYGERDGATYGWDDDTGINSRHDSRGAEGMLYLGSAAFGGDDERSWSIALPVGRYDCFIALGRPRDQERNDYKILYPLEAGDIRVWNHSVQINDRSWQDVDHQRGSGHPLAHWVAGMSDAGDKMDAAWVSNVTVSDEGDGRGRLTLAASAESDGLAIQFIQIYEHNEDAPARRRITASRVDGSHWECWPIGQPSEAEGSETDEQVIFQSLDPAVDHLLLPILGNSG